MKIHYAIAEKHGMHTLRELRVMYLVYWDCANEVRTLAAHMGVLKPVITRMFDSLEKRGYAKREWLKEDRRIVRLVLTETGMAAAMEIMG